MQHGDGVQTQSSIVVLTLTPSSTALIHVVTLAMDLLSWVTPWTITWSAQWIS